jgi:hypothetical protein
MVIAAPLVVSRDQRGRVRLMAIKRGHSVQDRRDAQ